MTTQSDEILLQIQQTRRELLSTDSWKRRKDLRRHMEKLQIQLDKLRGKEERKQNERQKIIPDDFEFSAMVDADNIDPETLKQILGGDPDEVLKKADQPFDDIEEFEKFAKEHGVLVCARFKTTELKTKNTEVIALNTVVADDADRRLIIGGIASIINAILDKEELRMPFLSRLAGIMENQEKDLRKRRRLS